MHPHPQPVSEIFQYHGYEIEITWKQYTNSCIGSVAVPKFGMPVRELPGTFDSPGELIRAAVRIAEGWIDRHIDSTRDSGGHS
jgi:hypothetical protein